MIIDHPPRICLIFHRVPVTRHELQVGAVSLFLSDFNHQLFDETPMDAMTLSPTPSNTVFDPAQDIYRYSPRPLQAIFAPQSVAVIGATEKAGSVGRTLVTNLLDKSFKGTVFPVNPKYAEVLGLKAYPSLSAIPVLGRPGRDRYACPDRPRFDRGVW